MILIVTCEDCGDKIRIDSREIGNKQACQCAGVTWYVRTAEIEREQPETKKGKADDAG